MRRTCALEHSRHLPPPAARCARGERPGAAWPARRGTRCGLAAFAAVLAIAAALGGCNTPIKRGKSPLEPTQLHNDTVVLDVFFVRYPLGDPELNKDLWNEVDEQQLTPDLRRRLADNGFRAGVVSARLPAALAKLLDAQPHPAGDAASQQIDLAKAAEPPKVESRHMPLRPGGNGVIVASAEYPQLPLLYRGSGELCGDCYCDAQGLLNVRATAETDGRVRLKVLPELQHGDTKQRWVGEQGMFRLEAGQEHKPFDDLELAATLAPGEMLLLTSVADRPGSVGHYFFTEPGEPANQKLLIIRLSQTQHNDLVPSEPLKLDY